MKPTRGKYKRQAKRRCSPIARGANSSVMQAPSGLTRSIKLASTYVSTACAQEGFARKLDKLDVLPGRTVADAPKTWTPKRPIPKGF